MSNADRAREFVIAHDAARGPVPAWAQVLNVVGEAGEFGEAYRRYSGFARRIGNLAEVAAELADVVIASYVAADRVGLDLDAAIEAKHAVVMSRGFGSTVTPNKAL